MEPSVTDMFNDPRLLAPPRTVRVGFDDGSFVLRSPEPLKPYARCIGEWLEQWAKQTPDALFLAEREASGEWRKLSYAQVRRKVGAIAQSLLGLHLPPGRPVVVLSGSCGGMMHHHYARLFPESREVAAFCERVFELTEFLAQVCRVRWHGVGRASIVMHTSCSARRSWRWPGSPSSRSARKSSTSRMATTTAAFS